MSGQEFYKPVWEKSEVLVVAFCFWRRRRIMHAAREPWVTLGVGSWDTSRTQQMYIHKQKSWGAQIWQHVLPASSWGIKGPKKMK